MTAYVGYNTVPEPDYFGLDRGASHAAATCSDRSASSMLPAGVVIDAS